MLKEAVESLKKKNLEQREKLAEVELAKAKTESALVSERAALQRAERHIKEKEAVIEERAEKILELQRNAEVTTNELFKLKGRLSEQASVTTELQKELEEYKVKLREKMMELSRANSSI